MNIYELQATLTLDAGGFLRSVEEAGAAFRSLGDGIGESADGIAERASGIASAFGTLFAALGGDNGGILTAAAEGAEALLSPFDPEAGIRIGDAAGGFGTLGEALSALLPNLESAAGAQDSLNGSLSEGVGGVSGMAEGLGALPALLDTAAGALGQWAADASAHWSEAASAAESAGGAAAEVLSGRIPQAVSSALSAIASLPGEFAAAGQQMASGMAGGFSSVWESAAAGIRQRISSLVEGVKDLLGIRSPSRVFAEIGGNMALGMEAGWGREFGSLRRTVLRDADALIPAWGTGSVSPADRVGFENSAIGRSSAAGIASLAAGSGEERTRPVEIRLMLDGREAAEALYDPLEEVGRRLGRSGGTMGGWHE